MSSPVYVFKTKESCLSALLPEVLHKCKFSFDSNLVGFILNSIVFADEDKASVKDDVQFVFIKYPSVPESPFNANPALSYVKVL